MKTRLVAILLMTFAICSQAEIVLIGNKNNLLAFDSTLLEDIFLGHTDTLSNDRTILPLDHASLHTEFYQKLTSKPIEQIDAYWARILFTGQALPDDQAVLSAVSNNKDTIGYIDKKYLNDNVRVLYLLN
jgi:ABC-type phosphate transport system substrate-binding protein